METELKRKAAELLKRLPEGPWSANQYTNYVGFSVYGKEGTGCIAERWTPSESQHVDWKALGLAISLLPDLLAALAGDSAQEPSDLQELLDAAAMMLEWLPTYSIGSAGYQRVGELQRALANFGVLAGAGSQ